MRLLQMPSGWKRNADTKTDINLKWLLTRLQSSHQRDQIENKYITTKILGNCLVNPGFPSPLHHSNLTHFLTRSHCCNLQRARFATVSLLDGANNPRWAPKPLSVSICSLNQSHPIQRQHCHHLIWTPYHSPLLCLSNLATTHLVLK